MISARICDNLEGVPICPQCGGHNQPATNFCVLCGAPVTIEAGAKPDPLLLKVVGNAYILQELIGLGGMGRVYRAEQKTLGRTVAVKVIHPHLLSDSQTVMRFYNEAKAASRLNHPNSVGVIDFGRSDDGTLYLVMEHIVGVDLARVLGEEGPVPFKRACEILLGVLSALDEAHALDVVHRDLKPENVILKRTRTGSDLVKVVDFGLATITNQPAPIGLNTPGMVCGTPDYMAPEQARGEQVDGRADLYAVGVMLFELLADRLPYEDEVPARLAMKHIHDPIPDPRELSPHRGIPAALAEVAMHAMHKDKEKRFQSALAMHAAVQEGLTTLNQAHVAFTQPPTETFGRIESRPPTLASETPMPPTSKPLIRREIELEQLAQIRERARQGARWVRVIGPVGVGKTTLLRAFTERCQNQGDKVVMAGPHPRRILDPYVTVRHIAEELCKPFGGLTPTNARTLCRVDRNKPWALSLAQSGVQELFHPTGTPMVSIDSDTQNPTALDAPVVTPRYDAVAAWLRDAILSVKQREDGALLVIAIDDLDSCDHCSVEVLARLSTMIESEAVLMLSSATYQKPHLQLHAAELTLPIKGLAVEDLPHMLRSPSLCASVGKLFGKKDTHPILPLYVDHVRQLFDLIRREDTLPAQLADVVIAQTDRLEPLTRKTLQASALLGDVAKNSWVSGLLGKASHTALQTLADLGWGTVQGEQFTFRHPFVRQVIENTIPAAAKELWHDRIFEMLSQRGASTEERAYHAARGSEPFQGLLWLDRAGLSASQRGDYVAATTLFREGLNLARKTYTLFGDETMEQAIINFTRKLGEALIHQGSAHMAEGILKEAINWARLGSVDQGRLMHRIGRSVLIKEPPEDATPYLAEALTIFSNHGMQKENVQMQRSLSAATRASNLDESLRYLQNALELAQKLIGTDKTVAACVAAELGEMLIDLGKNQSAKEFLFLGRQLVRASGLDTLGAIEGACTGRLGIIEELEGNISNARTFYLQASEVCGQAGDAQHASEWHLAALALGASTSSSTRNA